MAERKIPQKLVLLTQRNLTDGEWDVLEKFMKVYQYRVDSVNNRSLNQLLDSYDLVVIGIETEEGRQFWSTEMNVKRDGVGVVLLVTTRQEKSIIDAYRADRMIKWLPSVAQSAGDLMKHLFAEHIPRVLPRWKKYLKMAFRCIFTSSERS